MSETRPQSSDTSHVALLSYSTWLGGGMWLIYTGCRLFFQNSDSMETALFNSIFGFLRIFLGLKAIQMAREIPYRINGIQRRFFRLLTNIFITLTVGIPFAIFIFHIFVVFSGRREPDDFFLQNAINLLTAATFYLFATIYAGWKMSKSNNDDR